MGMSMSKAIVVLVVSALVSGCGQSPPPPASATGTGSGGGGGNPIDKLAENPNSLLGKSAATARNTRRMAESAQDAAVGTAQEISGEAEGLNLSGLLWSAPTKWQKVAKPSSTMRAAEFNVPSDAGNGPGQVAFFTNVGGDAASNIERWRTQFVDSAGTAPAADVSKRTIAGCKVSLVTIRGLFKGGQPGGPAEDSPDYGLRGAIVEGPKGSVFIKFLGPEATLVENEAAWMTMVNGMRKQ